MQLRVIRGEAANRIIKLKKPKFSLGRSSDNDYIISDPAVSRHHCCLSQIDNDWIIEDCQSVNGVMVNDRRVDGGMTLQVGDRIAVCNVVFLLERSPEGSVPPARTSAVSATSVLSESEEPTDVAVQVSPEKAWKPHHPPLPEPSLNGHLPKAHAATREFASAHGQPGHARLLRGLKIAIGLVLLAIIGLFFLLQFGHGRHQTVADIQLQAESARSDESVSATLQPPVEQRPDVRHSRGQSLITDRTLPRPDTAPSAPAGEQETPLSETESPQPDAKPLTKKGTGAPGIPAQQLPQAITRNIVIRSEPEGAEVIVDEKTFGVTPVILTLQTGETVSVSIVKQGYERLTRLLDSDSAVVSAPYRLVQKTGTVLITSVPPGATIREGRIIHGRTPLLLENLRAGTHNFLLACDGYERQELTVELTRVKGETIHVEMKSLMGAVAITTIPAGCTVALDGTVIGITEQNPQGIESLPLTVGNLQPGTATLRVTHPETSVFDNDVIQIPQADMLTHRVCLWIPTHKLSLLNGTRVIGLLLKQQDDDICLINATSRQVHIPAEEVAAMEELTVEEKKEAIRNRAEHKVSLGMQTSKSVLSTTVEEFHRQLKLPLFKENHINRKICLTGDISARMKNHGVMTIMFGKQIHCIMSAGLAEDDWQRMGELTKARKSVSIRGIWEGSQDGIHVFSNCVFLAEPD